MYVYIRKARLLKYASNLITLIIAYLKIDPSGPGKIKRGLLCYAPVKPKPFLSSVKGLKGLMIPDLRL